MRRTDRRLDRRRRLRTLPRAPGHPERRLDRRLERPSQKDLAQHHRERSGREQTRRMSVRERGGLATEAEGIRSEQPGGRDPHDAAASLAAVLRRLPEALRPPALQRPQAGVAWRSLRVEIRHLNEPAVERGAELLIAELIFGHSLGVEPPKVGAVHDDPRFAVSGPSVTVLRTQEALGREQRHLRVIRDGSGTTVGDLEPGNALRAVLLPDTLQREELDRCAEGIPNRSAQQATEDPLVTRYVGGGLHAVRMHRRSLDRKGTRTVLERGTLLDEAAGCPILSGVGRNGSHRSEPPPLPGVWRTCPSYPRRQAKR